MNDNHHDGNEQNEANNQPGIPKAFHSSEHGEQFRQCKICDRDLIKEDIPYYIEKAFKKYPGYDTQDVIFEYAICMDCAEGMRQNMSEESMKAMAKFFQEQVNVSNLLSHQLSAQMEGEEWEANHCLVTGKPIGEVEEYQIAAQFQGDKMLLNQMPVVLSGEAMDQLMDIISEETKGEIDRWKDDLIGIPPELKDLFKDRPVGII